MTAIHQKMAAITAEFPVVGKDNKAHESQGGYKYRGIDDALANLNGLLKKHGVYLQLVDLVPEFSDAGATAKGKNQTRCVVTGKVRFVAGEDGSHTECSLAGEGIDSADKALMKAQANGLKYSIWYTFGVPTYETRDSEAFEDEPAKAPAKKTKAKKTKAVEGDLLTRIQACESWEGHQALRDEVKSTCLNMEKGDPARAEIVAAFNQRGTELKPAG